MVTSLNAMAEFGKAIGGDKVEVSTIIPDGVESHDFELKPENMVNNWQIAQVFVYNGFSMEPEHNKRLMRQNSKLITLLLLQMA